MFNKINYITLVVKDMQKSISFYKEVLGLTVKMNMPQWAEFEMEGTSLALTPETAETKIDPGYGFSATFEDPNGYKITLTQSKW
ncbi:MAG: VOC family protein [Nitrospirae bacterium]|nr:VOC family protein [Nitrospirota bacterium]